MASRWYHYVRYCWCLRSTNYYARSLSSVLFAVQSRKTVVKHKIQSQSGFVFWKLPCLRSKFSHRLATDLRSHILAVITGWTPIRDQSGTADLAEIRMQFSDADENHVVPINNKVSLKNTILWWRWLSFDFKICPALRYHHITKVKAVAPFGEVVSFEK